MRIMFALTLMLLCIAGVTYAQDLQNTLTQPAAGDSIVPDIVSNISSQPEDPSIVQVLTSTLVEETRAPQDTNGVILAQMANQAHAWVAPPPLAVPTQNWGELIAGKQSPYESLNVVPEPGSFLVLAVGLSGLVTWRFRSRSSK